MFQKMLQMEGYKVDMLMTRHHAIVEEGQSMYITTPATRRCWSSAS